MLPQFRLKSLLTLLLGIVIFLTQRLSLHSASFLKRWFITVFCSLLHFPYHAQPNVGSTSLYLSDLQSTLILYFSYPIVQNQLFLLED